MAMTDCSAKEGCALYAAVIDVKSLYGTSITPCQKGEGLSDTQEVCTIPTAITTAQRVA
jgi:hypothetical protein